MNREEFKAFVAGQVPKYLDCGLNSDDGLFWIPEQSAKWQASYFCECWSFAIVNKDFLLWVNEYTTKRPLCFMVNSEEKKQWWGFNTEQDMLAFLMRWV